MKGETRIFRAIKDKDNPYFQCRRAPAQDDALSWEARGVLWYLLSQADDWVVLPKNLQQGCGRDKVYRILEELEDAGYLKKTLRQGDAGKFSGVEYLVYEEPFTENTETVEPFTEKPEMVAPSPFTPLPDTVLPDTVNPHHTYKEINTDQETTTEKITQSEKEPIECAPKVRKPRPRDLWIDTISECVFKVKPGTPLGKRTGARCGTIKSEVLTTYPDLTPEKFRQICAWKSPYISEDGPKLVKMIGEYEDQHKPGGPNAQHDDFRPTPRDDSKYAPRRADLTGIPADALEQKRRRTNPALAGVPRADVAAGTGRLPDVRGDEASDEKRAA